MGAINEALELAERGFRVFPLRDNSKVSAIKAFAEEATTNPEKISSWAHLFGNVGISTSNYGDVALLAVDIDPKKGGQKTLLELEFQGYEFPPTCTQTTPSGGQHLIYTVPAAVRQGVDVLGPGLDIRSKGGYIAAYGSTINGTPYKINLLAPVPAPQWLVDRCGQPFERPEISIVPPPAIDQERAEKAVIDYLVNYASPALEGNGGDEQTVRVACRVKDKGVPPEVCLELMLEHWNVRCEPPWSPEDLKQKVQNAYRYGQKPVGADAPEVYFGVVKEEEISPPKKTGLFFESFNQITYGKNKPALIEDLLDQSSFSVIYGESNVGKTFLTIDMALHIAMGKDWFGKRVEQGGVLYVAAEGGNAIKKRIEAFRKHYSLEGRDIPFGLVPCAVDLLDPKADTESLITLAKEAAESFKMPIKFVVIDTLSRAIAGSNENASEVMSAFSKNVDKIRTTLNAHIAVVHHSGKDSSKGARGHSGLRAAVDTEIEIVDGEVLVRKQRDMEYCKPFGFRLEIVDLGLDAVEKRVTSCVVKPIDLNAMKSLNPPLKENSAPYQAKKVLELLLETEGIFGPPDSGLEEIKIIHCDRWRSRYIQLYYPDENEYATGKRMFNRARVSLLDHRYIQEKDSHVYLLL